MGKESSRQPDHSSDGMLMHVCTIACWCWCQTIARELSRHHVCKQWVNRVDPHKQGKRRGKWWWRMRDLLTPNDASECLFVLSAEVRRMLETEWCSKWCRVVLRMMEKIVLSSLATQQHYGKKWIVNEQAVLNCLPDAQERRVDVVWWGKRVSLTTEKSRTPEWSKAQDVQDVKMMFWKNVVVCLFFCLLFASLARNSATGMITGMQRCLQFLAA